MGVMAIRNLSKSFAPGIHALKGVSLDLKRGEILGILGPNGAGKTTLIHLIMGLITPTEGDIEIFGTPLNSNTRAGILSRMNFASNYVSLPMALTVWENLMVFATLYGVKRRRERCEEMLRVFELYALKDRPSRGLSSGQMMRLCLSKALINQPEILLLDEPTAGLDPEIARKTRRLLREFSADRGMTVIYTSHNLWDMQEVSDRVLFLMDGEKLMEGTSAELLGRHKVETLEELFFKALKEKKP